MSALLCDISGANCTYSRMYPLYGSDPLVVCLLCKLDSPCSRICGALGVLAFERVFRLGSPVHMTSGRGRVGPFRAMSGYSTVDKLDCYEPQVTPLWVPADPSRRPPCTVRPRGSQIKSEPLSSSPDRTNESGGRGRLSSSSKLAISGIADTL